MATIRKLSLLIVFISLFCTALNAEKLKSPTYGYELDLPEGFFLAEKTPDGKIYIFQHEFFVTQIVIKIDSKKDFTSAKNCLDSNITKLKGKGETETFIYHNTDCALGNLSINQQEFLGQAATFFLKESNSYLTVIAYSPAQNADDMMQLHLSILDSVYIDEASIFSNGIYTSYAYPRKKPKMVKLEIAGKTIFTAVDELDEEAENFVINREFAIMKVYTDKANWEKAWQRYYRQIYKGSFERFSRIAFDIFNAINTDELTEIQYAQTLLSWVQGFDYKREQSPNSADFTCATSTLLNKGSDCDSRSMLMCILLQQCGIDGAMFVSRQFSHAIMGVCIDAPGQVFDIAGQKYLLGETTSKVTFGTVPQEVLYKDKWTTVILP